MRLDSPEKLGRAIQVARKQLGLTQADLAMTAGTGVRFIVDVEKGKVTSQIGKIMRLIATLGAALYLEVPLGVDLNRAMGANGGAGDGERT